jgi:cyclophilin family peptidyl-prolyl cis-trans isomerase
VKFLSYLSLLLTSIGFSAPFLVLHTSQGDLTAELYPEKAPETVLQISKLVEAGLYDTTPFFRLERDFVLQAAMVQSRKIPLSAEQKALLHKIPGEFSEIRHERGILSMARDDHDFNSAESSFSILLANAPHLDGSYTVFGKIIDGWHVLEQIESLPRDTRNRPLVDLQILKAEIQPLSPYREKP